MHYQYIEQVFLFNLRYFPEERAEKDVIILQFLAILLKQWSTSHFRDIFYSLIISQLILN